MNKHYVLCSICVNCNDISCQPTPKGCDKYQKETRPTVHFDFSVTPEQANEVFHLIDEKIHATRILVQKLKTNNEDFSYQQEEVAFLELLRKQLIFSEKHY